MLKRDAPIHILLTGNRNIGKSTIVKQLLNMMSIQPLGFMTVPYFDESNRLKGFALQSFDIALPKTISTKNAIGYTDGSTWIACPEVFDNFGVSLLRTALKRAQSLIVMDELGFFESTALVFQKQVLQCLDQTKIPVLAVVKNAQTDFLDEIKSHLNTELFHVSLENRNQLPEILTNKLQEVRRLQL